MAFVANATHVSPGWVHRGPALRCQNRAIVRQSQLSCRRGGVQFKPRTCTNTFLRWTAPKPGRGGRLTVVGAHSAIPEAAGLFNPANDKVCAGARICVTCRTDSCLLASQPAVHDLQDRLHWRLQVNLVTLGVEHSSIKHCVFRQDACGVGFVGELNRQPSRQCVTDALEMMLR